MTGLLLVNLGTPDRPDSAAVRRYLGQFLADPRVIDMNPIGRFLLLHLIILRFRPRKSAHAYQAIWTERGSPLLVHGQDLARDVAARLGDSWHVELAMRYGAPSLSDALDRFAAAGVDRVVVLPLFPQYASATTGSALEELFRLAGARDAVPHLSVIEPFHADPGFLAAFTAIGKDSLAEARADHVLFSFHGLPERQVRKIDASCLASATCCDRVVAANRNCYRAQCFATARALAGALDLGPESYSVTFQSRLGRTVWIQPYTDKVIDELARAGKKRLAVFCPAFVADCLETLEEIGLRARQQFLDAGGEELVLVPSLNASARWAEAIVALIARHAQAIDVSHSP